MLKQLSFTLTLRGGVRYCFVLSISHSILSKVLTEPSVQSIDRSELLLPNQTDRVECHLNEYTANCYRFFSNSTLTSPATLNSYDLDGV